LNKHSLVQLGYGVYQKGYGQPLPALQGILQLILPVIKKKQKIYWALLKFPVPKGDVVRTEEGLKDAIDRIGYPCVIKPIDGNHGKGNTTNITDWEMALRAFEAAKVYGRSVIVEKYITGFDFRILVINYKFICAALRTPASVVGDGKNTIQYLIDEVNRDPRRGYGHEKVLTQITVDQFTQKMLDEKGYSLETVPAKNELVLLKTHCQSFNRWNQCRCN
jgi:cyanophycin synthetase